MDSPAPRLTTDFKEVRESSRSSNSVSGFLFLDSVVEESLLLFVAISFAALKKVSS
ncbi:hypothetical protein KY285_026276 [Solanum tuberosum]|nr:hypothetical protein KY285_026276 [Solanum tuberosum]